MVALAITGEDPDFPGPIKFYGGVNLKIVIIYYILWFGYFGHAYRTIDIGLSPGPRQGAYKRILARPVTI